MTPAEIRAWRSRLGLNQRQAAEALDVTDRAIRQWERGDYAPSKPTVRLMQALEREREADGA